MPAPRTLSALSRRWRRAGAAVAAALALAGLAGCVPPAGTGTGATAGTGSVALRQLDELTVASPASMKGYSRDHFPHWRDTGPNCDVRDTVLKRDAQSVRLDGCNVVGGRWYSPYDGRTYTDPSKIDIDHVVPLANAWRSGADEWDDKRRGDFANDLTRPQLLAVSASTNRAKGDQNPAQWKPPNRDFWCRYAQDWVAVKHFWRLTVTRDEKMALTDMLATCPQSSTAA